MKISGINIKEQSAKSVPINNYLDQISLFEKLKELLPEGASILELNAAPDSSREGMSSYFDLTLAVESENKIRQFSEFNGGIEPLLLRPDEIFSETKYDCIFSNKGLVGLNNRSLQASIMGQIKSLKAHGIICHTFWEGVGTESYLNSKCFFHQCEELGKRFAAHFNVLENKQFSDATRNDSILLIAQKK